MRLRYGLYVASACVAFALAVLIARIKGLPIDGPVLLQMAGGCVMGAIIGEVIARAVEHFARRKS